MVLVFTNESNTETYKARESAIFRLKLFFVRGSNAISSILLSEFVCTNTLVLVTIFREIQGNRILQRF